mmetsp:Transcript_5856/g.9729  ORF Transcript_5856/g.9729 Transcript_5856/m.9729 type:complete len:233 (-) Transcript_5856:287-985(-)|eukprot:CAMPEP_0119019720 /NCGR_PEP_ID=MMETSP1176-20130426/22497_1 /TAXON_ID=265551 /ORGANISM="Synedropsis recta cf, Strain CCMP1620" /LENGTH=232 /DNA_ID=CAMNT_0006973987 /DNA_START=221 /DNA_END=919 /DNA_ORIENTATION=-
MPNICWDFAGDIDYEYASSVLDDWHDGVRYSDSDAIAGYGSTADIAQWIESNVPSNLCNSGDSDKEDVWVRQQGTGIRDIYPLDGENGKKKHQERERERERQAAIIPKTPHLNMCNHLRMTQPNEADVADFRTTAGDRIEYWRGRDDDSDHYILLETASSNTASAEEGNGVVVLVAGYRSCHPFVFCNEFSFYGSDGEAFEEEIDVTGGGAVLVQHLIAMASTYPFCFYGEG